MNIELNERFFTDALEAVNLAGLDDENVASPRLEFFSIDCPTTASRLDELDLVVGMAMRTGPASGLAIEEKDGHANVAVVGANEMVRAPLEGQVFLTDSIHREPGPGVGRMARQPSNGCK
jgi:hypothetical protein